MQVGNAFELSRQSSRSCNHTSGNLRIHERHNHGTPERDENSLGTLGVETTYYLHEFLSCRISNLPVVKMLTRPDSGMSHLQYTHNPLSTW